MLNYYTYVLIDPRTSQPFYVGKGKNRRMYDHWKHRRAKQVKNWRLKQFLCELDKLNLRPVYNKVIDNVSNEIALQKEIELVVQYGRLDIGTGWLCNLTDGGESGASSWSPATRKARSDHETAKQKGKSVSQYTLDGTLVATFSSAKVASEKVPGANRSYITQCCKKKRVSAGGFMWGYTEDAPPVYHHARCPTIQQYTKEGLLLATFVNSAEAAKSIGTNARLIRGACVGITKTHHGFVWKYA